MQNAFRRKQSSCNSNYTGSLRLVSANGANGYSLDGFISALRNCEGTVAVVGDHQMFSYMSRILVAELGASRVLVCHDSVFSLRNRRDVKSVIILCNNASVVKFVRAVVFEIPFNGEILFPSTIDGELIDVKYENPIPILACFFPCAGTGRLRDGFLSLLKKCNWNYEYLFPFQHNLHAITGLRRSGNVAPPIEDTTEAIYWKMRTLDYHSCLCVHNWVQLKRLAELDCQVVVLMRDPRDIVNSYYWLTLGSSTGSAENHLKKIIEGKYVTFPSESTRAYAFQWPDVKTIMNTYIQALEAPNVHIVRFEEINDMTGLHFQRLITALGIGTNPFYPLVDEDCRRAAHLGSIEYQTKGNRKRGQDFKKFYENCKNSSVRKGIVGDWRNSFTPATVELFKEYAEDGLCRLGYEADVDWNI